MIKSDQILAAALCLVFGAIGLVAVVSSCQGPSKSPPLPVVGSRVPAVELPLLERTSSLQRLCALANIEITDGQLKKVTFRNWTSIDSDLAILRDFPEVEILDLYATEVTARGLRHLEGLDHLVTLGTWSKGIRDEAMASLVRLPRLESLVLANTSVSDQGVAQLSGLKTLRYLSLRNTQVSDAAIPHLKKLQQLYRIDVFGTAITEQGANELRQAIPHLAVDR